MPQIHAEVWLEDFRAGIHVVTEDGFCPVQFGPHIGVLRSLSRKHEGDASVKAWPETGKHALRVACLEDTGAVAQITRHEHSSVFKAMPACLQCECEISDVEVVIPLNVHRKFRGSSVKCGLGFCREHQQLGRRTRNFWSRGRSLLRYGVGIGTADPECAHPGPARYARIRAPFAQLGIHKEWATLEIDC